MSQISWNYVAGFFDGEGCIYLPKQMRSGECVRVEFAQSAPQTFVLVEIQEFLEEQGIESKFYQYGNAATLKVFRHEEVVKILTRLIPLLHVKAEKAQEALALLKSRSRKTDTRCKRGHLWSRHGYRAANGTLHCRRCKRDQMRAYRATAKGGE